ncbi:MAG: hypothetical protein BWX71_00393 [Deltaproteobacteria bacterium ADurb.Bin072]|nr:MAG: hypothetical protein BWX71_00393 [Deltaproteobacteria bacterium ADurb.Bin072]
MNWLLGFFKKKKKKDSIISCLTKDETIPWDSPNVIYLAVVVTSDFGEFLENDGAKSPGIAETLLPHPKNEIEESILLLLRFINSKKSWSAMKKKYPDLAKTILTSKYYNVLKYGYVILSWVVNDDDAKVCNKFFSSIKGNPAIEDLEKYARKAKDGGLSQILERIKAESSYRKAYLEENFSRNESIF